MKCVYPWDDLAQDYHFDQGILIGAGSYGKVVKAQRNRNRSFRGRSKLADGNSSLVPDVVAIKYFKSEDVVDDDDLNRLKTYFGAEARALLEIRHKTIVWAYAFYDGDEGSALVMEYLEGGMLLETISAFPRFNEHDVRKIAFPLLNALMYCNETQKLVHRDIKPENILLRKPVDVKTFMAQVERRKEKVAAGNLFSTLNENGRLEVVLADFGFVTSDVRSTGFNGSRRFMAPEVLTQDKSVVKDWAKADIWSLGSVFFLMLSGGKPYLPDDQIIDMMQGYDVKFIPPSQRKELDHVTLEARKFLDNMLHLNPADRWPAKKLYEERDGWRDLNKNIVQINEIQTSSIKDYVEFVSREARNHRLKIEAAAQNKLFQNAQNPNGLYTLIPQSDSTGASYVSDDS